MKLKVKSFVLMFKWRFWLRSAHYTNCDTQYNETSCGEMANCTFVLNYMKEKYQKLSSRNKNYTTCLRLWCNTHFFSTVKGFRNLKQAETSKEVDTFMTFKGQFVKQNVKNVLRFAINFLNRKPFRSQTSRNRWKPKPNWKRKWCWNILGTTRKKTNEFSLLSNNIRCFLTPFSAQISQLFVSKLDWHISYQVLEAQRCFVTFWNLIFLMSKPIRTLKVCHGCKRLDKFYFHSHRMHSFSDSLPLELSNFERQLLLSFADTNHVRKSWNCWSWCRSGSTEVFTIISQFFSSL